MSVRNYRPSPIIATSCRRVSRPLLLILSYAFSYFALIGTIVCAQQASTRESSRGNLAASAKRLPEFEVATIKPALADNHKPFGVYVQGGGRIVAKQSTLKMLVEYAFDIHDFQIQGGPPWFETALFDVTALPPNDSPDRQSKPKYANVPPSSEQRQMLKALLIDRFSLKFHVMQKPGTVYFLVRGTQPLRLVEISRKDRFPMFVIGGRGNGPMTGKDVSMPYMASRLAVNLGKPVIDQTSLQGQFDFRSDPIPDDSRDISEGEFTGEILDSVTRLGLKLKTGKAPVQVVVIDKAERPSPD